MDAMPDSFILCADDYAQSEAVDTGVLQLLQAGRLTAVSCLVESPRWPTSALALREFAAQADIGLHLNLTHAFPDRPAVPLPQLLAMAWLRALPQATLEARIAAQIKAFCRHMGRLPDFIDGHEHVHQLPQVREALLRQVGQFWTGAPPWIRVTAPRSPRGLKALLIAALGGWRLRTLLRRAGIGCNPDFAGVYSLSPLADYRRLMQAWLQGVAPGGIIVCHPGRPAPVAEATSDQDPLLHTRWRELEYLASPDFIADCRAAGRLPGRFPRPQPAPVALVEETV